MHNDCLYETPDVEEALRRLPEKLIMERNYRMARAVQLSGLKKVLPKNEWTKYEDVKYFYFIFLNKALNKIYFIHFRMFVTCNPILRKSSERERRRKDGRRSFKSFISVH